MKGVRVEGWRGQKGVRGGGLKGAASRCKHLGIGFQAEMSCAESEQFVKIAG